MRVKVFTYEELKARGLITRESEHQIHLVNSSLLHTERDYLGTTVVIDAIHNDNYIKIKGKATHPDGDKFLISREIITPMIKFKLKGSK